MSLGERLKAARKNAGLTQDEVAIIVGIDHSTYSRYESDQKTPSLKRLEPIAKALNVTTDELLGIKKDSSEDEPIDVARFYDALVELELLKPGEDLSDSDTDFLLAIFASLKHWFDRHNK